MFYRVSIILGPFKAELYFKQFNLVEVVFVCKELNVKTVLFQTIQFSVSMKFKCQNNTNKDDNMKETSERPKQQDEATREETE